MKTTCGRALSRSSLTISTLRFTALVGHVLADLGDLGEHLEHDPLDAAPDRKITTRGHRAGMLDDAVSVTPRCRRSAHHIVCRTSSRRISISRSCSISVLTLTCSASASLRGDCRRSRRKYRR